MADQPKLSVSIATNNDVVVVHIAGEVGIANADALSRELLPVAAMKPQVVVFNVEDLTFIASLGLSILVEFHRGVSREGGHVRLMNPQPQVRDLLRKCRLDTVLEIIDSMDQAPTPKTVA